MDNDEKSVKIEYHFPVNLPLPGTWSNSMHFTEQY